MFHVEHSCACPTFISRRDIHDYYTLALFFLLLNAVPARAQTQPQQPALAQATQGPVKITLDDAIQLALQHNHALLAARSTIQQSQAQEITANLRPNPTLLADAQFLPLFTPGQLNTTTLDQTSQFDLGVSYLIERGKKRQHRLQAVRDQTAVVTSTVADNERTLTFNVASAFINVLLAEANLDLAQQNLKSFQSTVDVSEARFKAGDISEGDFLKIKLQLLQFQTDVSQTQLARVQALVSLRELLGYESVPVDYDVVGQLDYVPVKLKPEDAKAMALNQRPDLRAANQGVAAARGQYALARANGKRDVTVTFDYSHVGGMNSETNFLNFELPIFNRNQGEIARTRYAISQAEQLRQSAEETVVGDVENAYETVQTNDRVVQLYRSGYLDQAQKSRDISEYAYKGGAATLLDFLDAERSYRATQLAYRQALASYMLALEQFREAIGTRNLP